MYCKNCGERLKDGAKFCTSCGWNNYDNIQFNNNEKKQDKANGWLILLCVLIPLIGLVLYFVYKDTEPRAAKSYGRSSLISFLIGLVIFIIMVVFAFLAFYYAASEFGGYVDEIITDNFYEEDVDDFEYSLDRYVRLASGEFYKDIYLDDTLSFKCYDIDDLDYSYEYDGSIEVSFVNGKEKITVWFSDSEYYVDGVDYDTYTISDVKRGNKVDYSCGLDGYEDFNDDKIFNGTVQIG